MVLHARRRQTRKRWPETSWTSPSLTDRLILTTWTEQGSRAWKIFAWEWTGEKLTLQASRRMGAERPLIELVPRAAASVDRVDGEDCAAGALQRNWANWRVRCKPDAKVERAVVESRRATWTAGTLRANSVATKAPANCGHRIGGCEQTRAMSTRFFRPRCFGSNAPRASARAIHSTTLAVSRRRSRQANGSASCLVAAEFARDDRGFRRRSGTD